MKVFCKDCIYLRCESGHDCLTMKHIGADSKTLECPECHKCNSAYMSGNTLNDVIEKDLLD